MCHFLSLDRVIYILVVVMSVIFRGVPPSPRSDHAAAVHAERYLLIFGGGSHATCFNDLHVLDLHTVRLKFHSISCLPFKF